MSPYDLPDGRAVAICRFGGTARYYLCLFTVYDRLFEAFYADTGQYPYTVELTLLTEEVWDMTENYYRTSLIVLEGE